MRRLFLFVSVVLVVLGCSPALWAYTLTFDDIPVGQDLSYYSEQYGVMWFSGFQVVDQSQFSWSQAHSGTKVLVWTNTNPLWAVGWEFGADPADFPDTSFPPYNVQSVGAYFSTDMGQVLTFAGYSNSGTAVASAIIGSSKESWQDHYVEIVSQAGDIAFVDIIGVSSVDARLRFSLDDLTVVPVPEPSSLATFGALSLCAAGGLLVKRRR